MIINFLIIIQGIIMTAEEIFELPMIYVNKDLTLHHEKTIKNKSIILNYLHNGTMVATLAEYPHDIFTDTSIPMESFIQTDYHFKWLNTLVYYVDKYEIELPEEFYNIIGV